MENSNKLNEMNVLNQLIDSKKLVTIFLVNGVQMRAYIIGWDRNMVFVNSDGHRKYIYKHAISTIEESTGHRFSERPGSSAGAAKV